MKQLAWILPIALVGIGCDPQVEPIDTVRNDVIGSVGGNDIGVDISQIQLRIRAELDDETQIEIFPSAGFESSVLSGPVAAANDLGDACMNDEDCAGSNDSQAVRCVSGSCWAFPQVGSSDIECNIYDILFTDAQGNVCEQTINSGLIDDPDVSGTACMANGDCAGPYRCLNDVCTAIDGTACEATADCTGAYTCVNSACTFTEGVACTRAADCGGPFRCRDGACRFDYQGDGAWLCYVAERWDLSNHVSQGACPDFFPEQ